MHRRPTIPTDPATIRRPLRLYTANALTKSVAGRRGVCLFPDLAAYVGLRVVPLRNTRHTCSSLLVALGVHPKVAQRILRHSQIAMTMEVYAEASEEEVRAALSKLSEAMGGAG
ncbi:hypothetical protein Stsp01_38730 [Streptomyces sp. NBRC 13847]|nr:hypothetical protein Stsp01_38730 [Streptomyces sp. NBRC 13847]